MKLATATIDPAEPCSVSEFPLRCSEVSHSVSVRETVLASAFSKFLAAGAVPLQLFDDVDALLQHHALLLGAFHLRLQLLQARLFAVQPLYLAAHFG